MKKTKSFITRILMMGMVTSLALSSVAFAAMPTTVELNLNSLSSSALITLKRTVENDLKIAETYAYLDVSEASPEAKEVILAARKNIIFNKSWVNINESPSAVVKDKEGNILYELPAFQDVFPEDWAVPVENVSAMEAKTSNVSQARTPTGSIEISAFENVYVPNPSPTVNTPCFGQVTSYVTANEAVGTWAYSGTGPINLGITNMNTGVSVAFVQNVSVDNDLWASGTEGVTYGARASTSGTPRYMNFAMGACCKDEMVYGGGMDLSYAANVASCSIPTISANNSKLHSFEKDTSELSKAEVTTMTAGSSDGWYNANETTGACIKDSDGKVIKELRSYQEIYGKDPPKSNYPPLLLEFLNKAVCRGAVLVETDSWPGIKSNAGQTYVCYSYSAFVNATEMPYANIEKNKVIIDSNEITEFKPVPGTIYICV